MVRVGDPLGEGVLVNEVIIANPLGMRLELAHTLWGCLDNQT